MARSAGVLVVSLLIFGAALWNVDQRTSAGQTVYGDASCDGHVNSIDAAVILQYSAGLLHQLGCPDNADVNGDGHTNSLDSALILQYAAGLIAHVGPATTPTPTNTRVATATTEPATATSPTAPATSTPTNTPTNTSTNTPVNTPTNTPTNTPVPPTPTPTSQFATFGSGTKVVGTDIAAGTYRTREPADCYWARLSGFGGTLGEIIANDFGSGPRVVTISPSDAGFESNGCGTWTSDLSAITTSQTGPFGTGVFIVGVDIASGTWQSSGGSDCYWERLSGFGGTFGELITNNFATIVTISPSDAGFASSRCGTWTRSG